MIFISEWHSFHPNDSAKNKNKPIAISKHQNTNTSISSSRRFFKFSSTLPFSYSNRRENLNPVLDREYKLHSRLIVLYPARRVICFSRRFQSHRVCHAQGFQRYQMPSNALVVISPLDFCREFQILLLYFEISPLSWNIGVLQQCRYIDLHKYLKSNSIIIFSYGRYSGNRSSEGEKC